MTITPVQAVRRTGHRELCRVTSAGFWRLLFLLAISFSARNAHAQDAPVEDNFAAQHQQALQKNPQDVIFELRLKDGKAQFHPGETIDLELAFSSDLPKTYTLDAATYDRGGRLPNEKWHLHPPDGAFDPLSEYFREGGIRGGLRSMPTLTTKPVTITVTLNEWLRFEKPGKYRLYDVSTRIIDQRDQGNGIHRELPVTSNIVEFEILPFDAEWATHALREAVRVLDTEGRGYGRQAEDPRRKAARVLRFLNTPEAARELVRRFKPDETGGSFEYHIGLFGSPHRALIVQEMENQLVSPEHPISASFLHDLTKLKTLLANPEPMPPYPTGDETKIKQWQEQNQKRREAQDVLLMKYWRQLSDALPKKQGQARVLTLNTLFDMASYRPPKAEDAATPANVRKLRNELIGVFDQLPSQTQWALLNYQWPTIEGPDLLPVLRRLSQSSPQDYSSLAEAALRRLYELSPGEGRRIIVQEIGNPRTRFKMEVLGLLPDATLPALDNTLATNLEKSVKGEGGLEVQSQLVERYATPAVLPRVKAVYGDKGGRWACSIQSALLAYFLRADSAYGAHMVRQALGARKETGCYTSLLADVAPLHTNAQLEKIAVESLSDGNAEVVASAATMLGKYGSAASEAALWQRLRKFHEQWKDRAEELRYRYGADNRYTAQSQLERALWESLARGANWLAGKNELQRIRDLIVTSGARQELDSLVRGYTDNSGWSGKLLLHYLMGEPDRWSVAHYSLTSTAALKAKLAQFPRGTVFIWRTPDYTAAQQEKANRVFTELQNFVRQQGMRLER